MTQHIKDLTGQHFGRLTVIGPYERRNDKIYWLCQCDCGAEKWVQAGHLKSRASISCGCSKIEDLAGQRFGLWTITGLHKRQNSNTYWFCRCDCGTEKWVPARHLKSGTSISCGCSKIEDLTGQRFGLWIVIGPYKRQNGNTYWFCRCDCGTEKWVPARHLKSGASTSCGHKLSLFNKIYGIKEPATKKKRRKKRE